MSKFFKSILRTIVEGAGYFLLGALLLLSSSYFYFSKKDHILKDGQSSCWNDIDFKETEQLLRAPVKQKIPIQQYIKGVPVNPFNSTIFVLILKNGLRAVFKPGRPRKKTNSALLAYNFSQFMEWRLVPPTIIREIREIDGERGVVQMFVDGLSAKDYDFLEQEKSLTPLQKSNIYSFYFVSGGDGTKNHILFGKTCKEPALIDNESILYNLFIPYGDHPFFAWLIKNKEFFPLNSRREHKEFPLNRVQSVDLRQKRDLNELQFRKKMEQILPNVEHSVQLSDWYHPAKNVDKIDKLYFFEYRNAYWVKMNFKEFDLVYKNFVPSVFSKATIKRLKSLNRERIDSFLPHEPVRSSTITGILYRRDVILEKALKVPNL